MNSKEDMPPIGNNDVEIGKQKCPSAQRCLKPETNMMCSPADNQCPNRPKCSRCNSADRDLQEKHYTICTKKDEDEETCFTKHNCTKWLEKNHEVPTQEELRGQSVF